MVSIASCDWGCGHPGNGLVIEADSGRSHAPARHDSCLGQRFATMARHWRGLCFELDCNHIIQDAAGQSLDSFTGNACLRGQPFIGLVPLVDTGPIQRQLDTVAEVGEQTVRLTLCGPTGCLVEVEAILAPTIGEFGEPRTLVLARDLGEEIALRTEAAEARFLRREIVGAISHGILIAKCPGNILVANAAACRILGSASSELKRQSLHEVIGTAGGCGRIDLAACEQRGAFKGRVQLKRADASRIEVELGLKVVEGPDGAKLVVATIKDLSDLSRLESQRQCARAALERLLAGDHQGAAEFMLETLRLTFAVERIGLYRVDVARQSMELLAARSLPIPLCRALRRFSLDDQGNPLVRAARACTPVRVSVRRRPEEFAWLDSTARLCGIDSLSFLPIGMAESQVGAILLMPGPDELAPDTATLEAGTFLALAGVLTRLTSLEIEPVWLRQAGPWLSGTPAPQLPVERPLAREGSNPECPPYRFGTVSPKSPATFAAIHTTGA